MNTKNIDQPVELLDAQLKTMAQNFTYPVTPDLASELKAERQPQQPVQIDSAYRWVWAAAIALGIAFALLSAGPARTLMLDFLQAGPIRIFLIEPYQATITPTATATGSAAMKPGGTIDQSVAAATPVVAVPEQVSNGHNGRDRLVQTQPIEPVRFQPKPTYLPIPDGANQ